MAGGGPVDKDRVGANLPPDRGAVEKYRAGKDVAVVTTMGVPLRIDDASAERRPVTVGTALARAAVRDLRRLIGVLAEPVTGVRRGTLVTHLGYLRGQLQAHHRWQHQVIWPSALAGEPGVADLRERSLELQQDIEGRLAALLRVARRWRVAVAGESDGPRLDLRSAAEVLLDRLPPLLDRDAELLLAACAVIPVAGVSRIGKSGAGKSGADLSWADLSGVGRSGIGRSAVDWPVIDRSSVGVSGVGLLSAGQSGPGHPLPTRLARRTFWLLDDLDPVTAGLLVRDLPRPVMWVLRNGFSGPYNRASYLMWVGGGTGPVF